MVSKIILKNPIIFVLFSFAIIFANFCKSFMITQLLITFGLVLNFDNQIVSYFAKHKTQMLASFA